MKQFYLLYAGILLMFLASCESGGQHQQICKTVKIDTVLTARAQGELQYPGKVKAAADVSLAFRVSGTIQHFLVNEGSHVRQGQLMAELDPTDYQIQLDATEAEFQQIKAEAERVMALYQDNGTTPNANDKAVYGLKQIIAKRKHHQDQLAYTHLYAPFAGVVQKRLFDPHETVGAGMPVVSIVSNGIPEVEINLPAAEYIRRQSFENYHCTFDIYPGKIYSLKFISVTPKTNANQLYTMRLQLVADGQPLPSPGMNTMVTITCKQEESDQLSVSSNAIFEQFGKTFVYIYQSDTQTVKSCPVDVLFLQSNGRTLITSPLLQDGNLIVASGVHHLHNGEKVSPIPTPSPTNIGGLL
ncbi:efflux transporter, RND family, MFP subunit [gut metagenome]|uniref:Efflux transporter, RND family, MFP subunit n=1 Tax=gut metagenome TaxID=749906 RepID=J9GJC3_9ZZZZ